jgi:SAM-dependent methyltransferase
MGRYEKDQNLDHTVIDSFGQEWATFNYFGNENDEALDAQFLAYCAPIDLSLFDSGASVAADFGAGSGRWTSRLLKTFSFIYALEPSNGANEVLKNKFAGNSKVQILQETVGANSIPNYSLDLAVSLGVLHHIPDTGLGIKEISKKIKPGGYFLCYLYYDLEGKPWPYRLLFKLASCVRVVVSHFPQFYRKLTSKIIALLIYCPLSRFSKLLTRLGIDTSNFPLHHYEEMPFIFMANDALDRFGTTLEKRFNQEQITAMLLESDFDISTLNFSSFEPFWTFSVQKPARG